MPLSAKVSCVLDIARRVSIAGEKVRAGCMTVQPGGGRARTCVLCVCVCVCFPGVQQNTVEDGVALCAPVGLPVDCIVSSIFWSAPWFGNSACWLL